MNNDNTATYTKMKQLIYGRKQAERITGLEVKLTRLYQNCVLVIFEKGQHTSPRFISKAEFKKAFADFRKESGKDIFPSYEPLSGNFHCVSSRNIQDRYTIKLYEDHLTCTCGDWSQQQEIGIKKPMCKHAYSVLNYIGCTDLKDYIKNRGIEFLDHQKPVGKVDELTLDQHQRDLTHHYEF